MSMAPPPFVRQSPGHEPPPPVAPRGGKAPRRDDDHRMLTEHVQRSVPIWARLVAVVVLALSIAVMVSVLG